MSASTLSWSLTQLISSTPLLNTMENELNPAPKAIAPKPKKKKIVEPKVVIDEPIIESSPVEEMETIVVKDITSETPAAIAPKPWKPPIRPMRKAESSQPQRGLRNRP